MGAGSTLATAARRLFEAGGAQDACASVTVRVVRAGGVSGCSLWKVGESDWGRIGQAERERISTHLDQCQVFQIEPEEVISVKRRKYVSWWSHFLQIKKMCGCYSISAQRPKLCRFYLCSLSSSFIFNPLPIVPPVQRDFYLQKGSIKMLK